MYKNVGIYPSARGLIRLVSLGRAYPNSFWCVRGVIQTIEFVEYKLSILVKYFASVSDLVGTAEMVVESVDIRTANDVWKHTTDEALPANLLVAINQEHARIEDAVNDGDEVAFFPPVTGG